MRRLKIYEQLLIVFFIAVLLPLCIAAFIVTNVNQHAVREEIRYSANITADSIYNRLINSIETRKDSLLYIVKSLNYIKSPAKINLLLNDIANSSPEITKIKITNKRLAARTGGYIPDFTASNVDIHTEINKRNLTIYAKLHGDSYILEVINLKKIEQDIFKYIINDKRQVYIIDSNKKIVMSYNRNEKLFTESIKQLPKKYVVGHPKIFGQYKNQPNVYLKLQNPDWALIVITPKNLTNYGIIKARYKIIHALIIAAISIIIIGVWYTLSLNTNIKQLLKAISAIGRGNYRKRVRLLRGLFTPYEFLFLSNEFNKMIEKIDNAYKELQLANRQLSKLDEMKSNLIDTVSHEFRTPLTCIKGYTSRLLRNDINVDEETRIKSLKVIKQQTERLSRLIEDLLVIPDIESSRLRLIHEEIDLREVFETCIMSIQQKQARMIRFSVDENMPAVFADPDRVEQVIINLLDNAIKYSPENSEIDVNAYQDGDKALIKIYNDCMPIPDEVAKTLFGKFTRLDENLTRTTRGTGLGLFIAKGLIEAMDGTISIATRRGFEVSITLPLKTQSVSDDSGIIIKTTQNE